jgi:dihydrodipicolinate synthase/N-acetylneuraminate lyase
MKTLYPLFGIVTVLNTPFRDDLSIDYSALKRNVRVALEAGVAGFLVPALASEVYKLTRSERLNMVNAVLDESGNQVPVIAGTGENTAPEAIKVMKEYFRLGCRNILFQIPYENEVQFRAQFTEMALAGPGMIMLQDWHPSGYGLPDELICSLFEEVEAFRCLKVETVPAGVKYSGILEKTGNRLNVSGGWAVTQMTEGLERGVHAFMPTAMHEIYTRIYSWHHSGKKPEAVALFHRILPVLSFANQHLDISIHFFKRLLFRQGIYPTPLVREPALPFDSIHMEIAEKHIKTVIELENELQCIPKNC